jgi:predicted nucleotidyltransferase
MARKKEDVIKSVEAYAKVLNKLFDNLQVRLYGSYHLGSQKDQSDIDVAVISDDFKFIDYFVSLKLLQRLKIGIDLSIEPISLTPEEFNNPEIGSIQYSIAQNSELIFPSK